MRLFLKLIFALSLAFLLAPLFVHVGHRLVYRQTGRLPGRLRLHPGQRVQLDTINRQIKGQQLYQDLCIDVNCSSHRRISAPMIEALIFQEDRSFRKHAGFSPREMRLAIWNHLRYGARLRGASTISQQIARTILELHDRNLQRKLLEFRIARLLEVRLGKKKIIQIYLNNVYYGRGAIGLQQASKYYFHKDAVLLVHSEIAFLIAQLPSPGVCHNQQNCRNRAYLGRKLRLEKHLQHTFQER